MAPVMIHSRASSEAEATPPSPSSLFYYDVVAVGVVASKECSMFNRANS